MKYGWICVYLYVTKAQELKGSVSKEESFKKQRFEIRNKRISLARDLTGQRAFMR